MTSIKDIAFTCYPSKNLQESKKFYEGLLGLVPDPEMNNEMWVEYPVGSNTFALGSMDGWVASKDGGQIAFEVADLDAIVKSLKENNVKIQLDIQPFPNCKMAMVHDPDGSVVILHQKK